MIIIKLIQIIHPKFPIVLLISNLKEKKMLKKKKMYKLIFNKEFIFNFYKIIKFSSSL
jgi:hypothetical protein